MRRFLALWAVVGLATCAGRESLAARTAAEREARHAERDGATPRDAQHGHQGDAKQGGDAKRGAQGDKKPDEENRKEKARQGKKAARAYREKKWAKRQRQRDVEQGAALQRFGARVGDLDGAAAAAMLAATQAPLTWDGDVSSFEPSVRANATTPPGRRVPFFLKLEPTEPLWALAKERLGRGVCAAGGDGGVSEDKYHEQLAGGSPSERRPISACALVGAKGSASAFLHPAAPAYAAFTVLSEPAARALRSLRRFVDDGKLPGPLGAAAAAWFRPGCAHDFRRVCAGSDACRLGGACGLFSNPTAYALAGGHGRSLRTLLRLARDDALVLATARRTLAELAVVGVAEQVLGTACLVADHVGLGDLAAKCCRGGGGGACPLDDVAPPDAAFAPPLLSLAARANGMDRALYREGHARFSERLAARFPGIAPGPLATATVYDGDLADALNGTAPPGPAPPRVAWAAARIDDATGAPADGDALAVKPLGVVVFAGGALATRRAFRAAESLRRAAPTLRGAPLHATLVTDATGLAASADFSRSGAFDRAVNAFGNSAALDEALESGLSVWAGGLEKMLALRRAKQAAVRFGVALYERAVVLDADTFACDARALDAVAAALEDADVVVVSEARTPKCPGQIARVLGVKDLPPEYNTGVLGLSRAALPLLERWDHWHARLRCNGQDQPAFRAALTEAVKRGLRLLDLGEDDAQQAFSEPSAKPYNCRARDRYDNETRKDKRGQCGSRVYGSCSIIHGHDLSGVSLRGVDALAPTQPAVAVFLHIPKTAGHSVKAGVLPWLRKRRGDAGGKARSADATAVGVALAAARSKSAAPFVTRGERRTYDAAWFEKRKPRPGAVYAGAFAHGLCDGVDDCAYFTVLRDPVDRLISEHNYCVEVDWVGDQTCSGPAGARALQRLAEEKGFMAFARARGNVLLAHLAAPVTLADFAFRDDPFPWHARDPETRVSPIEVRQRRLGPPGAADLAAAKALLARRFAVVGLTERFDESMRAFAEVLAGAPLPASVLAADKASSHTRHADDDRFVSRADLSKDDEKKLASLLAFDLKLYAFAKERFEARYGNGTTS